MYFHVLSGGFQQECCIIYIYQGLFFIVVSNSQFKFMQYWKLQSQIEWLHATVNNKRDGYGLHRVSKSCNHAITRLRKIFKILRTFLNKEHTTEKTGTNILYLLQFDKVFFSFTQNQLLVAFCLIVCDSYTQNHL